MFEYVKLRNFKSFGNITFDMTDRYKQPKKMILIYGENGIGKSNIASAFYMLRETLNTMDLRSVMESILADGNEEMKNDEGFRQFLRERYKDMDTIIHDNKTVDSDAPMYVEYGFRLCGKSGRYILETDDNQIIHERLEYILTQRRGIYFDITPKKQSINSRIFRTQQSHQAILDACHKFWGKHSLLSIILYESDDKADRFIRDQLTDNLGMILNFFSRISCRIKCGSTQERGIIGLPREILANYSGGSINPKYEYRLDQAEEMLNAFFTKTYKDVQRVYYKRKPSNGKLQYKLIFVKHIAGKDRNISYSLESTGTQALIQQLPFMLVVAKGSAVIIDEFDSGIHDLLVRSLATSLYNSIDGQLIMTTHNTLLMESDIPKECLYVINELGTGDKEIQCILHYDNKIGKTTNIRDQYLLGRYTGIPENVSIDFRKLLQMLNKK